MKRIAVRAAWVMLAVLLVACVPVQTSSSNARSSHPSSGASASPMPPAPRSTHDRSNAPSVDYPDRALTPGTTFAVGMARICVAGYASRVRDVSDAEKAAVYARYGVAWVPYQHEVDHLISLELGGSNAIRNLWPEPYAGRWGARTKDVLENRLHDLVCSGELALAAAQHQEATDWVTAYRRYVGTPPGGGGGARRRSAATTPRATRRPPRSTAPTTRSGTTSRQPTACISRLLRKPSRDSRTTICTSLAESGCQC